MIAERATDLIILAAFPPEIEPLIARLPAELSASVRCHTVGIGIAESAARAAMILSQAGRPDVRPPVLFIGSAGSIGNVPEGTIVNAAAVSLADANLDSGRSYLPERQTRHLPADAPRRMRLQDALEEAARPGISGEIYTPLSVTADEDLGAALSRVSNGQFENLELFGIAAACAAAGVPWNALCPVTNEVGRGAHADWVARHARAAEDLAELLAGSILRRAYCSAPKAERPYLSPES